jgi:hypothetical protein
MTDTLSPALQEVVQKVRALRAYTKETGFQTSKSCSALLARLNADDLAAVCTELNKH